MKIFSVIKLLVIFNLLGASYAANAIELSLRIVERSSSLTKIAISNNSAETHIVPVKTLGSSYVV